MPYTLKTPTNDPSLPSYLHPLYLEVEEELELVWDCWHHLKDRHRNYLPREPKEPEQAYRNRLKRTKFDNRFLPAIRGHAGLLSDFVLSAEVPESIQNAIKDIDQQGTSLVSFLENLDEMVLRDGGCAVLVEAPTPPTDEDGNPLVTTGAEEAQFDLRPYLVAIDRRDILSWRWEYRNSKPFLKQVTIRETHLVDAGDFGCRSITLYRVLRPGTWELWEMADRQGQWVKLLRDRGETGIEIIPLVWYCVSGNKPFQGLPPFLNLAELNIEHFQKRSSLNEVQHKCNLPVPVRKGMIRTHDLNSPLPPLTIGPNSVVDVPVDGDFFFREPSGSAIAATQADISKLEASMDRVSLAFLNGGEGQKTATEVVLDTAQTQATLDGMIERKRSAVEQIFDLWRQYTGEPTGGSIELNAKILQVPPDPQKVQTILNAMSTKISPILGLQMLLAIGWLPPDTDIEAEERWLADQVAQAQAEATRMEEARNAQLQNQGNQQPEQDDPEQPPISA